MNKGIMFSTSKFQSGCIEYAEAHGLALVRIIDGNWLHEVKDAQGLQKKDSSLHPKYTGEPIYNKKGETFTSYILSKGWIDSLKEFILK